MPEVTLDIEEHRIAGWTSVQVQRSLDQLCDTFDLALTSPLSSRPPPVDIREGQEVLLKYDGETMLCGYIDEVDESSNANAFNLRVSGRSKGKDLVDCSCIKKGGWKKMSVDKIAADIAGPFGLKVSTDLTDLPSVATFKLQDSETAFDAVDRLIREYAMRVVSQPNGDLLLTRTGLIRFPDVAIERGRNVIEGGIRRSENERFSQYIFKATAAADDFSYGEDNAASYAAIDEGIGRYRPLIVHRDGQARNSSGQFTSQKLVKELETAANWERNTRAGKSQRLTYRVLMPGSVSRSWEMPGGKGLWTPNVVVAVRDSNHAVDGMFLITSVSLTRTASGTETQLELTHPEAYEPEKPPHKKKKGGYTW